MVYGIPDVFLSRVVNVFLHIFQLFRVGSCFGAPRKQANVEMPAGIKPPKRAAQIVRMIVATVAFNLQ